MKTWSELKVLFLVSAFNGLSQKVWCHLAPSFGTSRLMLGIQEEEIHRYAPDLILCPFLKAYLPDFLWQVYPCLVFHPGPAGDGGPSSLNWAVLRGEERWGVTLLQANQGWDQGAVWATREFALPLASVSSLYRGLVSDLALEVIPEGIQNFLQQRPPLERKDFRYQRAIRQADLAFAWSEPSLKILRNIHAGDSLPGARALLQGQEVELFGARLGGPCHGEPGQVVANHHGEVQVATGDGSLWIARLAPKGHIKVRALDLLEGRAGLPQREEV